MNFVGGPVAKNAVPPITETVTATVLALAGAAPLGTARRIVPLVRSTSRAPALRLKIVFAPSRVIVRSVNVSSARDSFPVRTALCNVILSFTTAGRGAPCASNNRTSSIIWGTRASCNGAATANGVAAAKNKEIHQRAIDLPVKVLERNLFISTSYCDARAASGLGFGAGCVVALHHSKQRNNLPQSLPQRQRDRPGLPHQRKPSLPHDKTGPDRPVNHHPNKHSRLHRPDQPLHQLLRNNISVAYEQFHQPHTRRRRPYNPHSNSPAKHPSTIPVC